MSHQAAIPQDAMRPAYRVDHGIHLIRKLLADTDQPMTAWEVALAIDRNKSSTYENLRLMQANGELTVTNRPARGVYGQRIGGPAAKQYALKR